MKLIRREDCLSWLEAVEGTPDIKILSRMRRAGKSKLLEEMARTKHEATDRDGVVIYDLVRWLDAGGMADRSAPC